MSSTPDRELAPATLDTSPPITPISVAAPAPETESEVIARLAAMRPFDYDRVRKENAKALGIQVKTLDERVKAARNDARSGGRQPFVDIEPAEQPMPPDQLFSTITETILRFVVLDREQAHAATLWVAHTHLVDVADTSPIMAINAPERACAKTLLQNLLGRMCHRSLPAANASASALFRAVEMWQPTLLIDEADTFFRDNAELHGMVNAGYKRGGFVLRSEPKGDSFEPQTFAVYGAKSIAGIALERHLPDAAMSRSIVINMRRKLSHEKVERLRHAEDRLFERLASHLARFAVDHAQQIRLARPHLPEKLSDRAQDNWEPLLAIAACAGEVWLQHATAAALKLSAASESSASASNDLLGDIQEVFDSHPRAKISTVELLDRLTKDEEKAWATYNRGRPITPRQLAKHLEVYGIKPKTVRMPDGHTPKGYEVTQFDDAFKRYLRRPADAGDTDQPSSLPDAATPPRTPPDEPVPDDDVTTF